MNTETPNTLCTILHRYYFLVMEKQKIGDLVVSLKF